MYKAHWFLENGLFDTVFLLDVNSVNRSMEQPPSTSALQESFYDSLHEATPLKRPKKETSTSTEKTVVVLKSQDFEKKDGTVFMADTVEVARFNKVQISSEMSQIDITKMLTDLFPYLGRRR